MPVLRNRAEAPLIDGLSEAERIVSAIRDGQVDAFVVYRPEGHKIFVLEPADYPYRMVIEAMSAGAAVLAPDSTILYCNSRFACLMEAETSELVGQRFQKLVHRDDSESFATLFLDGFQRTSQADLRLRAPRGGEVSVTASVSPLRLSDTPAVCLIASEVGVERNLEKVLRDVTQLLAQVISSAREGIMVLDEENNLRIWNQYMEELTGIPAEKAVGGKLADVFQAGSQRQQFDEACSGARRGESVGQEFAFRDPRSGQRCRILITYSPLRGELAGVLAVAREIREESKTWTKDQQHPKR